LSLGYLAGPLENNRLRGVESSDIGGAAASSLTSTPNMMWPF
jgi:hypothetical protein